MSKRLLIKLHDDERLSVTLPSPSGILTGLPAHTQSSLIQSMSPLISSVSQDRIVELMRRAEKRDPSYMAPNLLNWYVLEVSDSVDSIDLANNIAKEPTVEFVSLEPGYSPPPSPVATPDDTAQTTAAHMQTATTGIGASAVSSTPGGQGAGVSLVIIEQGWQLDDADEADHHDLPSGIAKLPPLDIRDSERAHGMHTLGVIAAVPNSKGVVGIAPDAGPIRLVSEWEIDTTLFEDGVQHRADALMFAIDTMESETEATFKLGNVLLIEGQVPVLKMHTTQRPAWATVAAWDAKGPEETPIDALWESSEHLFQLIRLATALGIVVIEPTGGGGVPLGTLLTDPIAPGLTASVVVGTRDSGAIIVTGALDCQATENSVTGSRVDCFGPIACVPTTTIDDGYVGTYSGSSAAAAVVAGAALVTQAIYDHENTMRLSPLALRALLKVGATPGLDDNGMETKTLVGVMPNLGAMAAAVLGVPDVYVRDHAMDDGEPHTGPISSSPDVFVRQSNTNQTVIQLMFGEGSPEQDATPPATVDPVGTNYVYVRARNRGGVSAAGVTARVYWAPVSTLVLPPWNLVGTATFPDLPADDGLMVSNALIWDGAGTEADAHYCFVCILDHPGDPGPEPAEFGDFNAYRNFIRFHNNVTWRNFNTMGLVPPTGGGGFGGGLPIEYRNKRAVWRLPFVAPGPPDRDIPIQLEMRTNLPKGSRVALVMPEKLAMALGLKPGTFTRPTRKRRLVTIPLPVRPKIVVGLGLFGTRARHDLQLIVYIPPRQRGRGQWSVVARQLFEGDELGRVTWSFAPPSHC